MQFCFCGILRRGKAQGTEVRSLAARRAGLERDATQDRRLHCESAGRVLRRDRTVLMVTQPEGSIRLRFRDWGSTLGEEIVMLVEAASSIDLILEIFD